jgi:hypothetical protein
MQRQQHSTLHNIFTFASRPKILKNNSKPGVDKKIIGGQVDGFMAAVFCY